MSNHPLVDRPAVKKNYYLTLPRREDMGAAEAG